MKVGTPILELQYPILEYVCLECTSIQLRIPKQWTSSFLKPESFIPGDKTAKHSKAWPFNNLGGGEGLMQKVEE